MKLATIYSISIAALLATAAPAQAGGYLNIPDIPGEATAPDYKDWIEIVSVSYGAQQPPPAAAGSPRRRGDVQFDDVVLIKEVDASSPELIRSLARGKVFPEMTIEMTKPGGRATGWYVITLKNVMLTSVEATIVDDGGSSEELALNFEEITWSHRGDGTSTSRNTGVEATWRIEEGK